MIHLTDKNSVWQYTKRYLSKVRSWMHRSPDRAIAIVWSNGTITVLQFSERQTISWDCARGNGLSVTTGGMDVQLHQPIQHDVIRYKISEIFIRIESELANDEGSEAYQAMKLLNVYDLYLLGVSYLKLMYDCSKKLTNKQVSTELPAVAINQNLDIQGELIKKRFHLLPGSANAGLVSAVCAMLQVQNLVLLKLRWVLPGLNASARTCVFSERRRRCWWFYCPSRLLKRGWTTLGKLIWCLKRLRRRWCSPLQGLFWAQAVCSEHTFVIKCDIGYEGALPCIHGVGHWLIMLTLVGKCRSCWLVLVDSDQAAPELTFACTCSCSNTKSTHPA